MKKRIPRLITALALAALTATGIILADQTPAAPQDSGWGAPAPTTPQAVDDTAGTVTPLSDSGWG